MDKPKFNTANPNAIKFITDTAHYIVLGGLRKELDSLKITLLIESPKNKERSRQKIDLYEDNQTVKASRYAADKLALRADLVEMDLSALTDLLEDYRNEQLQKETPQKAVSQLNPETARKCSDFLRQDHLPEKFNELIGKSGVVGEERNRLFLFMACLSYKRDKVLHILCQGSSGQGKTHLQESIAKLLPKEDRIEVTRITDYSFYNYGKYELQHKILFVEDIDSLSEEALLALREMQSKGKISMTTTIKDENNNLRAIQKTVYGPLATVGATTRGEIYEDNSGRCFIIAVDESSEQTQRIIRYQDKCSAGKIDKDSELKTQYFIQNCVRLLKQQPVINPYAEYIQLPPEAHKLRRLNQFFKSLIEQITWIHQYQRKQDRQGRLVTSKEDIRQAIDLLLESLIWKIDELDGSLRNFYERLKHYIKEQAEYETYQFSQREIRHALRISKSQLQRNISSLISLEYLHQSGGNYQRGYTYQIAYWDDAIALREKIKQYMYDQLERLDDPSRSKQNGSLNKDKASDLQKADPKTLGHLTESRSAG